MFSTKSLEDELTLAEYAIDKYETIFLGQSK